jgi:eukaryotic-like serine/threonine-protein kinase
VVGSVIGNYQIVRKLGEGGMGAVYLGQHTLLGRRAAIKVLRPELSTRTDIVNRFFNEARAVTAISDPGIVQVFDFGYHADGSAFIVMEFLEGEALDHRLARLGRLRVYEALLLCRQLANSLGAAHAQHIVHRDLKPENVFLVRDAEVTSGERSKILDFGIAKLSDDHPNKIKTGTGMLMGTPAYMSPEQCRGLTEIDHRSDIHSLGCVLFHLLTGRLPFEGEGIGDIISAHIREPAPAPSSLVSGISAHVDALVLRCLAKTPSDRFQTMVEIAAAIGSLLQQLPVDVPENAASRHHLLPTTKMPLQGASSPAFTLGASTGPVAPVTSTTLGASASQFTQYASRRRQIGLWIVGGLVVGATGLGIAIVGTRGPELPRVTSLPTGSTVQMAAPVLPAQDAGSVALVQSPKASPEAGSPPATNVIDAGSGDPSDVATTMSKALEQPRSSTPGAGAGPSVSGPAKRRPRDPGLKTETLKAVSPPGPANAPPRPRPDPRPTPPAQPPPQPNKCGKSVFAAVYNAVVPPPGSVRAALHDLKVCHDAGAISDAEFEQIGDALAARM